MSIRANPASPGRFCCLDYRVSKSDPVIELDYQFEGGPVLTERFEFLEGVVPRDSAAFQALDRAASLLHLAAGVSYYKAGAGPRVTVNTPNWSATRQRFFERFYRKGLAEFAYRNHIEVAPQFESSPKSRQPDSTDHLGGAPARLETGQVVPLGGGKDSLVSCDLLARESIDFRTIAVGSSPVIRKVASAVGREHIQIRRSLAPELRAMNDAGALNGHVPITGILGFALICGAWYYGYDHIVMSNESSADEPTLVDAAVGGVNHQFAKSLAFEQMLAELLVSEFAPSARPTYFSLLRPLNEVTIARVFAFLEPFHDVFTSCNANFVLAQPSGEASWCRKCPKCRFVYLALAPFMRRERLQDIFGADLLDDTGQLNGYRELLELGEHKPFECVGTALESQSLMRHLMERADWQDAAVVGAVGPELATLPIPGLRKLLKERGPHRIPEAFQEAVDAIDRV